ncbi:serine protease [Vibrio sinensis]|uniref:Serine protease n=1 Tax=Vibrio sinensis TaxID=2302434 RepID=A0A3A6QXQ1_9VIBR|nr:serine protease [Vibrio sinensis]RJX75306.1 serine protease [Vibrio sinensis]
MRVVLMIILVFCIASCSNGVPTIASRLDKEIEKNNEKIFIGIPFLLGMEASTVRLDENWVITSKHNEPILSLLGTQVHYHPLCDIALINQNGDGRSEVGMVYNGESISHVGYPIGFPLSENAGVYIGEVIVDNWKECTMSASTGVVAVGMSGGGVYNQKGQLVGINHGFLSVNVEWADRSAQNPSVFLALFAVREWLEQTTGRRYFDDANVGEY